MTALSTVDTGTVLDRFLARVEATPDATAVVAGDTELSYRDTLARARALATRLRAGGVEPGGLVAICVDRSEHLVVAPLAVWLVGAAYLPLDPAYPPARTAMVLEDAGAAAVVTTRGAQASVPGGAARVFLIEETADGAQEADGPAPDGGDAAYVIYTSGSTGRPKGVVVGHEALANFVTGMERVFGGGAGHRWLASTSLAFDISGLELYLPLTTGGAVVVSGVAGHDGPAVVSLVDRRRVTHVQATPSAWRLLLAAGLRRPELVALVGGEALPLELARRLRESVGRLVNMYGPTETTIWSTCWDVPADPDHVSIGRPIDRTTVWVLDPDGGLLPIGVPGELHIGGAGVAHGYLRRPELTAERFVPDPFAGDPVARLYRTGDRVRWRADGTLEYLGRFDDQLKLRGHRIEPGEIESVLLRHPAVAEAAVVVRPDPAGDPVLVAYVSLRRPEDGLRAYLSAELPPAMVPGPIVVLDRLPVTPNGKLDRKALPAPGPTAATREPATPTEVAVAGVWRATLGVGRLGADDDVFALGGHSLQAMAVSADLAEALGRPVPVGLVFAHPTVAELAAALDGLDGAADREAGAAAPGAGALAPIPVVERVEGARHRCSHSQVSMWLAERLNPDRLMLNTFAGLRLVGDLDRAALEGALADLVARHEMLRTVFEDGDGEPWQVVLPSMTVPLSYVELADGADAHEEADRLWRERFDLTRGPLLRAVLARVGEREHLLLTVWHHIVIDAWSLATALGELGTHYHRRAAAVDQTAPALPVQYLDFAAWERRRVDDGELDAAIGAWREKLAGDRPDAVVASVPAPPGGSARGAKLTTVLPAALVDRLRGAGSGVTPFQVLITGFTALLARYTGCDDVTVGVLVAGRPHPQVGELIGSFVQTLPARATDVTATSFRDLLGRVRGTVVDAVSVQDVPYDLVKDPDHPPLRYACLMIEDGSGPVAGFGDLAAERWHHEFDDVMFDLSLQAGRTPDGLQVTVEYRADRYDDATAQRFATHLRMLFDAMADAPDEPIGRLPLLTDEEHGQAVDGWNPAFDGEPAESVLAMVNAQPEGAIALVDPDGTTTTYGELRRRAGGVARELRSRGVRPEEPVAVHLERTSAAAAAVLGVLGAGAAFVPVSTIAPTARIAAQLADAGARFAVTTAALTPALPPHIETIDVNVEGGELEEIGGDRLAYIIYTSGSTGVPKGVRVTHANLANTYRAWRAQFDLPGLRPRLLQVADLGFDVFTSDLVRGLCSGGTVVFCPRETVLDPAALHALMVAHRISAVELVPAVARMLAEHVRSAGGRLDGLDLLVVGSDQMFVRDYAELVELVGPHTIVVNSYGVTEAAIDSTAYAGPVPPGDPAAPMPIGWPMPGMTADVVDAHGRPAPVGVAGELVVGGDGVARGYTDDAQTAARFGPDPLRPGKRVYRTGDLARRRPDGAIDLLGRADGQLKIRGYRIEPGEIEAVLRELPGVLDGAVTAWPGPTGQLQLVAHVVGAAPDPAALRTRLPEYMVPTAYVVLDRLPLNASGKVDRRALPAPDPSALAGAPYAEPTGPAQRALAGIWRRLLGVDRIGAHDSFVALGGHSLLAARLVAAVRSELAVELPLRAVFDLGTVAALADLVDGLGVSDAAVTIPARPSDVDIPLSPAQRRMWFLEQLEPGTGVLNVPDILRLRGPLDVAALERAWNTLCERHEALRTRYPGADPVQVVAAPVTVPLTVTDVADETAARALAEADLAEPFSLVDGPLWRLRLLRLAPDDHVLSLVTHHSITDDWSGRILFEELALAYAGEELPPAPVSHGDVAAWQWERLSPAREAASAEYWRAALAGAPEVLDLPADRPRPPVQRPAGGQVWRRVPAELSGRLDRLASAEGATGFMTLLAAYAVLLARFSGQADVTVGAPVAGRDVAELQRVVGCLLNTLVLRVRPAGTFRALLRATRATVLDALGHADLPFERLVDLLNPARSLAHSPLFQAMFNVIEADGPPLRLRGVEVEHFGGTEVTTTKADLSMTATRHPGGLDLHVTYRADLFDPDTAADLVDRYITLLGEIAADPDRDWLDLPLGSAATPPVESNAAPGSTLGEIFQAQALRTPHATALVSGSERVTYAGLNARVNRLAHALRRRGIGPGELVAVAVERSADLVVSVLGVLKAGGAYVPLDTAHPTARLAAVLERARPALLLTDAAVPVPFDGPRLHPAHCDDEPAHDPAPAAGPDDLAYVVHTSGSTGVPKGVLCHHRGAVNYLSFVMGRFGVSSSDTVLQVAGISFDASVRDLIGPLSVGATVVLLAPEEAKEPAAMLAAVDRHRVTGLLSVVPTLLRGMVASGASVSARSVRLLLCSGERMYRRDVADAHALLGPQVTVVNQYGPTECTMTSTYHVAEPGGDPAEPLPVGGPIDGSRVHVLDHRLRPVPPGVPGEVWIGGVGVTAGYLNDPEQTDDRFRPDPHGARMYRTGDRGRLRRDGTLVFLGRLDQQVKIRGLRVEPGEVEAHLRELPGVRAAAVVAVAGNGPAAPPRLVGYLAGAELDLDAFRATLRERLPDHLVPAVLVEIPALPLTANGKVDRGALPTPPAPSASTRFEAPTTETERRIAAAFTEVLGVERVGRTDHFFDLGGDSFAAVSVARVVGSGMRVLDLFRAPTVAALASIVDGGDAGTGLLHELTSPGAPRTLSVIALPYAGGSPISFQPLAAALPPGHALYGVALPGHEVTRPDEEALPLEEVAAAVAAEIVSTVDGPVAVYGHCSGSAFAIEVARRLEAAGRPVHAVYVAAAFPSTRLPGRLLGRLTLDRFQSNRTYQTFFRSMGGFGDQLTQDEISQIIRNLRHDSTAAEDYYTRTLHDPGHRKLAAPILCVVGDRDPLTEYHAERVAEWEAFSERVDLVVLERSGHYFLKHRAKEVAEVIGGVRAAPPRAVAAEQKKKGFGVFAAVAVSQFVSLLGSNMTAFALGVWMFQKTGSVTLLGLIATCALAPSVLVSPFAGAVVDRADRRKVMLIADLGAGVGTLALAALIWAGDLKPWHLFVVLSWSSVCGAFQRPAYLSAVPQLIPKRYLARANGFAMSLDAGSQVLAPLVAGALVVTIGLSGVILIDVVTFSFSVLVLLFLRFPNALPWRRRETIRAEIAGGFRYITARHGIMALLIQAAACNILLAVLGVLVTPLVLRTADNPGALGVVMATGGVGALIGGLAMTLWGGPAKLMNGILGYALVGGVFIALLGFGTSVPLMAAGMFGFWSTLAVSNACYTVLIQVKVPHHLHGRVFAINQMVAFSTMPVGYLLAGPLADNVFEPLLASGGALAGGVLGTGPGRGVALLIVIVGVLTVVVNAAGYAYPRLRRLDTDTPDAQPDEEIAVS